MFAKFFVGLFALVNSLLGNVIQAGNLVLDKAFGKLIRRLTARLSSEKIGFFDKEFQDHEDPLLRGDLLAAAEKMWPRDQHPTFYKKIPSDIRRSIISDGRIRGTSLLPANVLAAAGITPGLVSEARKAALWAAVRVGVVAFLILFAWSAWPIFGQLSEGQWPAFAPAADQDFWTETDVLLAKAGFYAIAIPVFVMKIATAAAVALTSLAFGSALLALALAMITFWGSWRGLIMRAADAHAEPLRVLSKEATVRWKFRLDQRQAEEAAYLRQIEEIERLQNTAENGVIEIGQASGSFAYRGLLTGPRQGQSIRMAVSDLFQNTITLGGTGSGKTRQVLLPSIAQMIRLMDQQDLSLFVGDGKGVLWQDVQQIAQKFGREVQVVGIGQGEHGIDLLDGLAPDFAADLVRGVMRQVGGASADSFWPDMAHNMVSHCLTLLQAWELTSGGLKYAKEMQERPYSLVSCYRLAMEAHRVDGWASEIIEDVLSEIEQNPGRMVAVANSSLYAAIRYIQVAWPSMASDTRSGIEANITNALASFERNSKLRARFASGEEASFSVADCWGRKITCLNLPEGELGIAGRIVSVFIKSLLFTEAKQRQVRDPHIREKQQLGLVWDEFQSVITVDQGGVSDANFANEARSTGLFYFIATQGVAGLEQAIGQYSAHNFLSNMRNKIVLQIEEPQTIEFCKKMAGKTLRFYTYAGDDFESFEARRREDGFDASLVGEAPLRKNLRKMAGAIFGLMNSCKRYTWSEIRSKYEHQDQPIQMFTLPGDQSGASRAEAARAERWRVEDKNSDFMKTGNEHHDVLSEADFLAMGRSKAYCLTWRGGHNRQDLVQLKDISQVMAELA